MGYEQGQARGSEYQSQAAEQASGRDTEAERASGRGYATGGRHEHRGAVVSFTALAGTLMVLGGLWGVIVGLVSLSTNHVFITAPSTGYTYYWSYHGWGWVELILGIVLFAAGVCVFLGMSWARYVGAGLAVLSAIAHFMYLPYSPLWSIIMIALDAFIIWALLSPRRVAGEF
ncbi:MAG: DUF7144 family membrane protein [Streptosporangiaceae bacterium]